MKHLVIILAIFSCSWIARAESWSFDGLALEPGISIKGLSVPIGGLGSNKPSLEMKVGEISLELAKFGFVRVAVIPRVVFKDCILILHEDSPTHGSWALSLLDFMKRHPVMDHADIQGIQIKSGQEGVLVLKARSGKFLPAKGRISLENVDWRDSQGEHSVQAAAIPLDGPLAGCLTWLGDQGPCRYQFAGTIF